MVIAFCKNQYIVFIKEAKACNILIIYCFPNLLPIPTPFTFFLTQVKKLGPLKAEPTEIKPTETELSLLKAEPY